MAGDSRGRRRSKGGIPCEEDAVSVVPGRRGVQHAFHTSLLNHPLEDVEGPEAARIGESVSFPHSGTRR